MVNKNIFRIATVFLVLLGLALVTFGASAQTYAFQLTDELVNYTINDDGTVSVEYYFTFQNEPWASPIDFVDVGMPKSSFETENIRADVNGVPVSISSNYQGEGGSGFAVELGAQAITDVGTVHVVVPTINRMIYPDDEKSDYASSVFGTTYFGQEYVSGSTNLTVIFHFPVGVLPSESIYHLPGENWPGPAVPAMVDTEKGVTYTWHTSEANGHTQYQFGVSFPSKYVPESAIVRTAWLEELITWVMAVFPFLIMCAVAIYAFIIAPMRAISNARKRKLEYIKPTISAEGQGIRRGLTAVEAAILMAVPLDKVLAMILYGVTKKGAVQVLREDPLQVRKSDPLPEGLLEYETEFINSIVADMGARKAAMQTVFVNLVKNVTEKMKGFGKKETEAYYKAIIDKAWTQVVDANTPDMNPVLNEESFEWTMADRDFEGRSRKVFDRPIFIPRWYGNYSPSMSPSWGSGSSGSGGASPTSGKVQLPGADFAASMVTGVETFSGQLIGNINDFTGRITNVTNPVPVPVASSSHRRSGGGGGCACACACAGCACACAGGGR